MHIDVNRTVEILHRTPRVLDALTAEISNDWVYYNEGEQTWSAFDVVGHLIVCEKTDFLTRVEIVLSEQADKTFEPIDMNAHYEWNKSTTMADILNEFTMLRLSNIQRLRDLNITASDMEKTGRHPKLGETTLRELLATWAAHDLSHISQIARVMAKQIKSEVGPFISFLTILK